MCLSFDTSPFTRILIMRQLNVLDKQVVKNCILEKQN